MRPKNSKFKHHEGPGAFLNCSLCGAPIRLLLLTNQARLMPTDAAGVAFEAVQFDPHKHTSHHFTCAQSDLWRKPWKEKGATEEAP